MSSRSREFVYQEASALNRATVKSALDARRRSDLPRKVRMGVRRKRHEEISDSTKAKEMQELSVDLSQAFSGSPLTPGQASSLFERLDAIAKPLNVFDSSRGNSVTVSVVDIPRT